MPGHYHEEATGTVRGDQARAGATHPRVRTGSGFALGLIAGLLLKRAAKGIHERTRGWRWHRDYERTVSYDENLPASLSRREPLPEAGEPRYGGTGAIGVSPAAVLNAEREGAESSK